MIINFYKNKFLNVQVVQQYTQYQYSKSITLQMIPFLRNFLQEDQANLISLLLISIPLSFILRLLQQKYLILALSISSSIIFHSILFPTQKYFLWAQQQIVFILLWLVPRKNVGIIVLIESFIFLTIIQIRRMYIAYAINGVDITAILMMQTFLYIGLAYNYENGGKNSNQLSENQKSRAVKEFPSYLTYLGYVFFLPSCLIGPVFEFTDFQNFIERKKGYDNLPSTVIPTLFQFRTFVIFFLLYRLTANFSIPYILSEEYAQSSLIYQLFYIGIYIFHIQFKYIAAWGLGMISIQASGLSYDDNTKKFDKVCVTKPIDFFFNPSMKVKTQSWNMSVQVALKRYIYEGVCSPQKDYRDEKERKKAKGKAQLYTLMVSAYWHGFYPGYFITFFHWALIVLINQEIYRIRVKSQKLKVFWEKYKIEYLQNFLVTYAVAYSGVYFHLMVWQNMLKIGYLTYFIPFIMLYVTFFIVTKTKLLKAISK